MTESTLVTRVENLDPAKSYRWEITRQVSLLSALGRAWARGKGRILNASFLGAWFYVLLLILEASVIAVAFILLIVVIFTVILLVAFLFFELVQLISPTVSLIVAWGFLGILLLAEPFAIYEGYFQDKPKLASREASKFLLALMLPCLGHIAANPGSYFRNGFIVPADSVGQWAWFFTDKLMNTTLVNIPHQLFGDFSQIHLATDTPSPATVLMVGFKSLIIYGLIASMIGLFGSKGQETFHGTVEEVKDFLLATGDQHATVVLTGSVENLNPTTVSLFA